jgi:hypothetical protein
MDWFVCGNYASVSCGTWVGLWGGAIGAFVAAVIGGLVALVVVRLTNRHQSRMASTGRARVAAADLAAALSTMTKKYGDGTIAIEDVLLVASSASLRWQMELDDEAVASEIDRWPHYVGFLALDASHYKGVPELGDKAFNKLSSAASSFEVFAVYWHRSKRQERTAVLRDLKDARMNNPRMGMRAKVSDLVDE